MEQKCVLAMYEFRGKQAYIFRTNRLQEIIGASEMIATGFEILLASGSFLDNEAIQTVEWDKVLTEWKYKEDGIVVYNGGGNLFVLYRNQEICVEINRIFTSKLLKDTYSLKALCSYVNATGDFVADRAALYAKAHEIESEELVTSPCNTLPFVMIDRKTSLPIEFLDKEASSKAISEVSREAIAKRKMYRAVRKKDTSSKFFDDYITEKGEESLLAIVYIDGNNMGQKVKNHLNSVKGHGYSENIEALKSFSQEIDEVYVKKGLEKVSERLEELLEKECANEKWDTYSKEKKERIIGRYQFRKIIAAGDEVNLVCNARVAYEVAKAYLESLPETYSSCAGIAVFHSHAPYARAYRIAEECCENAKKWAREHWQDKERPGEHCLIDFEFCDAGIDSSLEIMREKEKDAKISRPWLVNHGDADAHCVTTDEVEQMVTELRKMGRSNLKGLAEYAVTSPGTLQREVERVKAHASEPENIQINEQDLIGESKELRILYDAVIMYDLWFVDRGE